MEKILLLGMCFALGVSHSITSLWVPRWAEPGRAAELRCQYTRQAKDPPLHSVKWYRDNDEIFRYTPHEPEPRSFNGSGVSVTNSSCGARACVVLVRPERGTARYTCEVSSEGPRFAVDKQFADMTLAVLPGYDPLITNLPLVLYPDEEVMVNCTSDYSLPPADIFWFLDDEPQTSPMLVANTHISAADGESLRASWRTLRLIPGARAAARGHLQLRCTATLPTRPPHTRSTPVWLHVASRPHISKFMANGAAITSVGRAATHAPSAMWTFVLLLSTKCLHLRQTTELYATML